MSLQIVSFFKKKFKLVFPKGIPSKFGSSALPPVPSGETHSFLYLLHKITHT